MGEETCTTLLRERANNTPHHTAVVDGRSRLDWSQLASSASSVATRLRALGLRRGDVVAVQLPNRTENVVIHYALKAAGLLGAYVPISWRDQEMRQLLEASGARLLVTVDRFQGMDLGAMASRLASDCASLERWVIVGENTSASPAGLAWDELCPSSIRVSERQLEPLDSFGFGDVSLICVSSGSTGAPKLCESRESAQLVNGRGIAQRLAVTPEDRVGVFCPLDGGGGLMGWLISVASGAPVVLGESFRGRDMLRLLDDEKVTVLATVPALLLRLLEWPDLSSWDLSRLRGGRTGTAALTSATAREAEQRLGATVAPAAGTMEVLTMAQMAIDDPPEVKLAGSVGRALPGNEIRIVNEEGSSLPPRRIGQIEVRGAGCGTGYRGCEHVGNRAFAGEWFRSGDLGFVDEEGFLYLKGRSRDVVLRGGRNVYPAELEALIMEHAGILEVAVVGLQDHALGECTRAYVVPKTAGGLAASDIRLFLESRKVAPYKIPDEICFLSRLPRLAGAKVDRLELMRRGAVQEPG